MRMGISRNLYCAVETGRRLPFNPRLILRAAQVLKVDPTPMLHASLRERGKTEIPTDSPAKAATAAALLVAWSDPAMVRAVLSVLTQPRLPNPVPPDRNLSSAI